MNCVATFLAQLAAVPRRKFPHSREYQHARDQLYKLGIDVESQAAKQALSEFAHALQQRRAARKRKFFDHFRRHLANVRADVLQLRHDSAKTQPAKQLIKAELRRRMAPASAFLTRTRPAEQTEATRVFRASDAVATHRFLKELGSRGPLGRLAAALFRCQKASSRAKKYRGKPGIGRRPFRELAYGRKGEAIWSLTEVLRDPELAAMCWGWGSDFAQDQNPWVLYLDLPNGQVSFHSPVQGDGPDYPGSWDHSYSSETRIIEFCDAIFSQQPIWHSANTAAESISSGLAK
jgi:hypothetical protein